jgi:hypothetical protein
MKRQRSTVLSIVMAFLAVILLVQLWLLVGTLEAFMGGEGLVGLPAALASGVCLLAAAWLTRSAR